MNVLPLLALLLQTAPDYATKVYPFDDVELSLYTPRMFRFRLSELEGEKFPARFEIPFAMGRLEGWTPVRFERWADEQFLVRPQRSGPLTPLSRLHRVRHVDRDRAIAP